MAFVVIALVVAILMAMAKDQARRFPEPDYRRPVRRFIDSIERVEDEELPGHQLRAGDVIHLSEWSADEAKQKENQK